jgi:predicted Fe-Mo cluster-binding NifX family protein
VRNDTILEGRIIVKVAFTTSGKSLEAPLEPRFGRAPKFLIYNMETKTAEVLDNGENLNAVQGAGVRAAEAIARSGVDCVITGHCGPKAFQALSVAGIRVYHCDAVTIAKALDAFGAGTLEVARSANVTAHRL